MLCPYCNKEMIQGAIQAGGNHVMGWMDKPSVLPTIFNMRLMGRKDWNCRYIPAFQCVPCKKIIIDFEEEKKEETSTLN